MHGFEKFRLDKENIPFANYHFRFKWIQILQLLYVDKIFGLERFWKFQFETLFNTTILEFA